MSATPCFADPALFFSERPDNIATAKALCLGCPERTECLSRALKHREPAGVWGGEQFLRGRIVQARAPGCKSGRKSIDMAARLFEVLVDMADPVTRTCVTSKAQIFARYRILGFGAPNYAGFDIAQAELEAQGRIEVVAPENIKKPRKYTILTSDTSDVQAAAGF
jgi:WhiB family redox-sensing transcriptional regulator